MAKKKPPTDPPGPTVDLDKSTPPEAAPLEKCAECQGTGQIEMGDPPKEGPCPACDGTGVATAGGPGDGQVLPAHGDGVVQGNPGTIDEPEPVNPIQAAAELQDQANAQQNQALDVVDKIAEPPAPVRFEVLPPHIIRLRNAAAELEKSYDAAAEEAKEAKKAWEKARETFEAAFDAEVRRQRDGQTPGLPFEGDGPAHMGDVHGQGQVNSAPATEEKGPAEVRQFPRAVPPAEGHGLDDGPAIEPDCQQCGHGAFVHEKPDEGPRTACTFAVDGKTCDCALYQLPPAEAQPEPSATEMAQAAMDELADEGGSDKNVH